MFQDRLNHYRWLESDRKSKLLVYITGDRAGMESQISTDALEYFSDHLDRMGKVEKISLYLYTQGGDTMAAWSLIHLIRQYCENFEVIVPSKARSSGTIICLGSDSIIMTKQATLGPIDPSVNGALNPQNPQQPNNPGSRIPVSVESIQGFIDLAKNEFRLNDEANLKEILIKLTEHVHPLVLGNVYRSRSQILMVARKLLNRQLGSDQKDKIDDIIAFLCSDSGSHDYAIYRNEAKDELGLNITKPNDDQYEKIAKIFHDIRYEMELLNPFNVNLLIGENESMPYCCRRAIIESINGGTDVFVTEGKLTKSVQNISQNPPLPDIKRIAIENNPNYEGWKHEDNNISSEEDV